MAMPQSRSRITFHREAALAPVEQTCSILDAEHLELELARLRDIERVALEFCARCERGEIRSVASYERFRSALAGRGCDVVRTPTGADLPSAARPAI